MKIREEALVRNKAVYVALGVRADGTKEILGLWIEQTEGAKFWLRVMTELKNRGVEPGFKWSSQHLERGGCDGCSEAAFGSVWARRVAVAWPPLGGTA